MSSKTIVSCDYCGAQVIEDTLFISAGVYGADFHLNCFEQMNAQQLVVALGIDDIKVMKIDDWQGATKINSYYRDKVRKYGE